MASSGPTAVDMTLLSSKTVIFVLTMSLFNNRKKKKKGRRRKKKNSKYSAI